MEAKYRFTIEVAWHPEYVADHPEVEKQSAIIAAGHLEEALGKAGFVVCRMLCQDRRETDDLDSDW